MSRKTSRNGKNALKKSARLSGTSRLVSSKIGLSSLALGSLTFGMTALAHAQSASGASGAEGAKAPPANAKTKSQEKRRLGNPASLRLAANTLPPDGAGLLAQATTPAADANVPQSTTSASTLQEIVVTGIRGSLERALQVKRMSLGVVDAVSAEDIGQFPDASIGQAIARIPGVTVDRGAVNLMTAAGSATSTGQVTGVTVRGFGTTFQEMLSNGRQIASGLGQNFDFSAVGADFVGEVDVHKTPDFSLSSGAVGATINVKFPNPFDHPGLVVRANLGSNVNSNDGGWRPDFGALISDTFADGTFGILADFDYHDQHVTTTHLDVVGWKGTFLNCSELSQNYTTAFGSTGCGTVGPTAPSTAVSGVPSWYPQEMAQYYERADERRTDGRLSMQWHPTDNVLVTLDDNYSTSSDHQDRWSHSVWFGSFNNVALDGNGTITSFVSDGGAGPTDFNAFVAETYLTTNTPGLNVTWDMTDNWSAELDAAQSTSHLNPNGGLSDVDADTGYGTNNAGFGNPAANAANNNNSTGLITSTSSSTVPYFAGYGPNNVTANWSGTNPFIIGSHVVPLQTQMGTDKINEVKLDATWHSGDTKVNFGLQYMDDSYYTNQYSDFSFQGSNNNWQLWSGYGPLSGPENIGSGVALPAADFTAINLSNFIPGASGNGNLPPGVVLYNPYTILSYLETQPINTGFSQTNGYPTPTYPNQKGLPPINLCPSCYFAVERKNYAPYVSFNHNFDLGGMPLRTDLGLRYQKTDVTVGGLYSVPTQAFNPAGDPTSYAFNFGPTQLVSVDNNYHYFLPSLDLNLMATPDFKLRLDASRTETAAPNANMAPNTSFGGRVNALTASSGNPKLLPYLSNNLDLGAEWYYASNDLLGLDLFYKHITQFPTQGTLSITLPINDPSPLSHNFGKPMVFADTTEVNGGAANVSGIEAEWQQMLGWGFGVQINGTYVHTNAPYNSYNIEQNITQFALPGIGNSANFIGFYQRGPLQARLAVQWQGREFLAFGQEQNSALFGTEPTYLEASTEVDFSTQYDINSHLSAYFEALNLTDAQYHTTGRFQNQLLNWVDYGRSFQIGVHAKL
jgi:iron complex outermembrane receptor protein